MSFLVCSTEENRGLLAPRDTFFISPFLLASTAIFPLWKKGDILALVASGFTITKNKTSVFQLNLRSKDPAPFPSIISESFLCDHLLS